jgi:gamma-glutamylcysteine synthetase
VKEMEATIREKLYKEFIEPTKEKKDYIGIEVEIPIINLDKKPVDFEIVHQITNKFQNEFNEFSPNGIDYDGNIFSLKNGRNSDIICYDCSYNNIEFAMGREKDLFTIEKRFKTYYNYVKEEFEKHNYTLTGMGINPYRRYNKEIPIPSERYLMLYHHLKSFNKYNDAPMHFHDYPGYGMFSSASQVQLDIHYDDLVKTINTFSKIEPIKAILFSNSVLMDENKHVTCFRDALWEYSTHGINPHNIGMYDVDFESIDDILNYMETLNIYCVMRDGAYINFESMNILEYFKRDSVTGEIYNKDEYREIEIRPNINDIDYLRAFKFINLTFRGTLEFRSVCTQPISETMTVAAFHLGLKDKIDNLDELMSNDNIIYHKGYTASELRKILIQDEMPPFINKKDLCKLTNNILDIAKEGLLERGIGEEIFLKPLYKRVKNHTNPGKEVINLLHNDVKLEKVIEEYGGYDVELYESG